MAFRQRKPPDNRRVAAHSPSTPSLRAESAIRRMSHYFPVTHRSFHWAPLDERYPPIRVTSAAQQSRLQEAQNWAI
jgi:hypothetical protein